MSSRNHKSRRTVAQVKSSPPIAIDGPEPVAAPAHDSETPLLGEIVASGVSLAGLGGAMRALARTVGRDALPTSQAR